MSYADPRQTCVFDSECFHGWWAIAFKCVSTGRTKMFDVFGDGALSEDALYGIRKIVKQWRLISFNGNNYDVPMLSLALSGATTRDLKLASDEIIVGQLKPWHFYERYQVQIPSVLDHVDLFEVAPGRASLKIYGGRVHTRRMQDLPFPPHTRIERQEQLDIGRSYLINDLDNTIDLYNALIKRVELRCLMSDKYGSDLRSKSDPQLSEVVLKHDVEKLTHKRLYKPDFQADSFRYRVPTFIKFESVELNAMLDVIERATFFVNAKGSVDLPPEISRVTIGGEVFRMGIGGLHSSEKKRSFYADDEYEYVDVDATSYYPAVIDRQQLHPPHIGPVFNPIFKRIVVERIEAKKAEDTDKAEMYKIVILGAFGKFGNMYSVVYAPDLLIQTTVTGQLALLMLIEQLSKAGFRVISANTDGVTTQVDRVRRGLFNAIVFDWELETSFLTEATEFKSLHYRDVNSYLGFKTNGSMKLKGAFATEGLQKNPDKLIAVDAAIAYLRDGIDPRQTIEACRDIRKFLTVRTVNGGAIHEGTNIGKAIRFYISEWSAGALHYATNGNKVPKTEGAMPMLELRPDYFPDDVAYDSYVREAEAILEDVGVRVRDPAIALLEGWMYARLPAQKNLHIVYVPTGIAACGRARSSIREQWVQFGNTTMTGQKFCGKCRKEFEL